MSYFSLEGHFGVRVLTLNRGRRGQTHPGRGQREAELSSECRFKKASKHRHPGFSAPGLCSRAPAEVVTKIESRQGCMWLLAWVSQSLFSSLFQASFSVWAGCQLRVRTRARPHQLFRYFSWSAFVYVMNSSGICRSLSSPLTELFPKPMQASTQSQDKQTKHSPQNKIKQKNTKI